jgi:hypothetical protein
MEPWRTEFYKGKNLLSHHDASGALKAFKDALKLCPPRECICTSHLLFFIGIALKRLGHYNCALKLWISANRIKKSKRIKKMIERYANGYGMLRQATEEIDDRNAFFSIQIQRYLDRKHDKKFSTQAEQDVVFELLNDYWINIQKNSILCNKSVEEKRKSFHRIKIPFPYFIMPKYFGDSVLNVNFTNCEHKSASSRCFCGSGLPFAMCCGRTPAVDELMNGVF